MPEREFQLNSLSMNIENAECKAIPTCIPVSGQVYEWMVGLTVRVAIASARSGKGRS